MSLTRIPINPPMPVPGHRCTHCYSPLAATAQLVHGYGNSYDWVHADTGRKDCRHVAFAEPTWGLDAIAAADKAFAAREAGGS